MGLSNLPPGCSPGDPHIDPPQPLSELFWDYIPGEQLERFERLNEIDMRDYDLVVDLVELAIAWGIKRGLAQAKDAEEEWWDMYITRALEQNGLDRDLIRRIRIGEELLDDGPE